MRLSDIMSHMGLASYPEIALAIFLMVFFSAAVWTFLPGNVQRFARVEALPLQDNAVNDKSDEGRS